MLRSVDRAQMSHVFGLNRFYYEAILLCLSDNAATTRLRTRKEALYSRLRQDFGALAHDQHLRWVAKQSPLSSAAVELLNHLVAEVVKVLATKERAVGIESRSA